MDCIDLTRPTPGQSLKQLANESCMVALLCPCLNGVNGRGNSTQTMGCNCKLHSNGIAADSCSHSKPSTGQSISAQIVGSSMHSCITCCTTWHTTGPRSHGPCMTQLSMTAFLLTLDPSYSVSIGKSETCITQRHAAAFLSLYRKLS